MSLGLLTLIEHVPVLLKEAIQALQVRQGGRYIDCTVGAGGHAATMLEASSPGGELLGIDADPEALERARTRLQAFGGSVVLVNDNFRHLVAICERYDFRPVDGILFDLGISSLQLAGERGFSFMQDAPLDMRFDPRQRITAADIVNSYPEDDLARIIYQYGEDPRSRRIARLLVENRPLYTTSQLVHLIERAIGTRGRIHPATRTFQALRIAVNDELRALEEALSGATGALRPGGRLVVISFHSLEDRIVKRFMQQEARDCVCPPQTPRCLCGHKATLRLITRKVVTPSPKEISENPRSRSAKMRVAERLQLTAKERLFNE